MPRIRPSLFWRARREISPMAAELLPVCRDFESTSNELRWIREHVHSTRSPIPSGLRVWKLCQQRGKGVPLQYVLGTQPFGDLEIKCRPGVLIPRPETEAYTLYLTSLLAKDMTFNEPTIIDLCTGTGCIPLLLLHSLLAKGNPFLDPITIHAVDVSPDAIRLAKLNYAHNIALGIIPPPPPPPPPKGTNNLLDKPVFYTTRDIPPNYKLTFTRADIFSQNLLHLFNLRDSRRRPNLLISNPPYISPSDFARTTARSVRNYEPRLALVPDTNLSPFTPDLARHYNCEPQDIFYARILQLVSQCKPKRVLMEIGDMAQAERVVGLLQREEYKEMSEWYEIVEIWRDEPAAGGVETKTIAGREVGVRGEGRGRAVYLFRGN